MNQAAGEDHEKRGSTLHQKKTLVVATYNQGKVAEIQRILADSLGQAAEGLIAITSASMGLPDPEETGTTFEENALLKARDAAERTGLPAMADDSGLIVDLMGRTPGVLSARWAGRHGDDAANNALLLSQLSDLPDGKRQAHFCCACALVIPRQKSGNHQGERGYKEYVETGVMPGIIIRQPRGENGFGYDPIFVPDDQSQVSSGQFEANGGRPLTTAQMTAEQKNTISHRGAALRAMAVHIKDIVG